MAKIDKEAIRAAAAGRCPEILSALGGLTPEQLDPKKHQPCPKCGGTDRFRAFDDVRETGGLLCNNCGKFSDIFAAVQWLRGVDFRGACDLIAEHLGLTSPGRKKPAQTDPAKDLDFKPWAPQLIDILCSKKQGYSESAILAAGGRLASYKRHYSVVAFPVIGPGLDTENPVGWLLISATGGTLPRWDRNGVIVENLKVKITHGSQPGLVGLHAIERLKVEGMVDEVWKVEGISDLISLLAKIPAASADRHVAITNAHGAGEKPGWMASILAGFRSVNVVHDADNPGQTGAMVWCQAMAAEGGKPKLVKLPYTVQEKAGKDLRDWFGEGNDYADLLGLATRSETIEIKRTESGEVDYKANSYPVQEQILRKLQLEVLYETSDGRIRVFSWLLGKSSWIVQVDRLKKEKLVQVCGPPAMSAVSTDPDGVDSWSIGDVRIAIALAASMRREESSERGVGVWQGLNEKKKETDTIVLVNDTEAARYTASGLERIVTPRSDGLVLDLGAGRNDWFEYDDLKRYLEEAKSQAWRNEVIKASLDLFGRWNWRSQEVDPMLVTGLVLSSWVQTVWTWRPLVAVIAESNTGKSLLFEALGGSTSGSRGIFGDLAFLTAKSTEPGIRQGVGNSAKIILCDEFEASKEREKILEMFRASTRGSQTSRGTSSQQGRMFGLRHIAWVANTESGLKAQPDTNRFVQLNLLPARKGEHGKLVLPDPEFLVKLGQKLLAIALTHAMAAKELAVDLKKTHVPGIQPRLVEVYSVPAAMLALACGFDRSQAEKTLSELLAPLEIEEQGESDHDTLLADILGASVYCGAKDGMLTIGQLIENPSGTIWTDHRAKVEAVGVDVEVDDITGQRILHIAHTRISRSVLRTTNWHEQRIDQLLMRLPGARRSRKHIGGQKSRVVSVPIADPPAPRDSF